MKSTVFISIIALSAMSLCAQSLTVENLPIVKDGRYWVRMTGELNVVPAQPHLQVGARGHITLRGTDKDQITWRMKQRVHVAFARTEEEARTRLGGITAVAQSVGNLTRLEVNTDAQRGVSNELEITVPKAMLSVVLQTLYGGIEAYDINGDVRMTAGSGDLQMDRIGGNVLQAQTGGGNIYLGKIGGSVQQCSTGAGDVTLERLGRNAFCTTAGGDILVEEASGPLNLATDGGNIRVAKAASSVNALSGAGLIDIGHADGPVVADARGGSIHVAAARGIQAESVAGMVSVRALAGPISVSTALGNILAELVAGAHLEDSTLVAGSGDVTVLIPSNFPVSIMWPRTTRNVVSDFPELQANSTAFLRSPAVTQGALNGGGPVLRINAGAGVIYLRRIK